MAKAKKVSISSAIIAGRVGSKYYMTWDNINDAYSNGMEMLCHTYSHPLTTDEGWPYDYAFFEEDYRKAKNILVSILVCVAALLLVLLVFHLIEKGIDKSGAVEKAEAKQAERMMKKNEGGDDPGKEAEV